MKVFENKVAFIAGGSNGIGRCIDEDFRKQEAAGCIIKKAKGKDGVLMIDTVLHDKRICIISG